MMLGLIEEFDAAHSLPGYEGKCANLHGHTYMVEMVIEGPVGEDGFVIDFYRLKKILKAALQDLDHHCLNDLMANPTAEKIAEWISKHLERDLAKTPVDLVSLKLWEGKNKWVLIDARRE
ncbi:MAG TPA: 6-carboxytetrahydropterin synthase QueD [Methanothrix sp.]|nr:6-carboxytetrahydropterin synthase QueD [Methanothrix sp.]